MSLPSKISTLETQLAVKRARYEELKELIPKLEAEKFALVQSEYAGGRGEIPDLRREIEAAKHEHETSLLPEVRVKKRHKWDTDYEWRFIKRTAKRIFLRRKSGRDEYWELDGKSKWFGAIEPADLARILDGTITESGAEK